MNYTILHGDNRETLRTLADNSIDAIVTDPPYGIDFLGKAWDANTGALETYQQCLRVLKPGGHILAFSAARTYHHLAVTLEQAGFEIRDQIMWIYSSGFPKSQDIGRQLHKKEHGKPDKQRFSRDEMEPVKTATPPNGISRMTFNQSEPNKLKDTGLWRHKESGKIYKALPDINGDKLAKSHEGQGYGVVYEQVIKVDNEWSGWGTALKPAHEPIALARKPMKTSIAKNCQQWGVGALNIDATRIASNELPNKTTMSKTTHANLNAEKNADKGFDTTDLETWEPNEAGRFPSNVIGEIPEYQKYFYCPKVSRSERHVGFDLTEIPTTSGGMWESTSGDNYDPENPLQYNAALLLKGKGNNHPTVKPIELMKYLIKLITPPGGTVLDPFNGSGSTGCAAVELGHPYIGCELDAKYVDIAKQRIEAWYAQANPTTFNQIFTQE